MKEIDEFDGKAYLEGPENPYFKHGGYDYGTGMRYRKPLSKESGALKWLTRPTEQYRYESDGPLGYGDVTRPCRACGTHFKMADVGKAIDLWNEGGQVGPKPIFGCCQDPRCDEDLRRQQAANKVADGAMHQGNDELWKKLVEEAKHVFEVAQMGRFGEVNPKKESK